MRSQNECSIQGCVNKKWAREMCNTHYKRDKYLPGKTCFFKTCENKCTSKYMCVYHFEEDTNLRASSKRRCRMCENILDISLYMRPNGSLFGICDGCHRSVMSERWSENFESNKNIKLKGQFGITIEQYNEMLIEQDGVCALCQKPEVAKDHRTGKIRALAVHHNHNTGEVLALCCGRCNRFMGQFNDDPEVFKRAVQICKGTYYENS